MITFKFLTPAQLNRFDGTLYTNYAPPAYIPGVEYFWNEPHPLQAEKYYHECALKWKHLKDDMTIATISVDLMKYLLGCYRREEKWFKVFFDERECHLPYFVNALENFQWHGKPMTWRILNNGEYEEYTCTGRPMHKSPDLLLINKTGEWTSDKSRFPENLV